MSTSETATLLRELIDSLGDDHGGGAHDDGCYVCQIVARAEAALLAAPLPLSPLCVHCGHDPAPSNIIHSVVTDQPGHPVSARCVLSGCQDMPATGQGAREALEPQAVVQVNLPALLSIVSMMVHEHNLGSASRERNLWDWAARISAAISAPSCPQCGCVGEFSFEQSDYVCIDCGAFTRSRSGKSASPPATEAATLRGLLKEMDGYVSVYGHAGSPADFVSIQMIQKWRRQLAALAADPPATEQE